jgi:hypothetical protein
MEAMEPFAILGISLNFASDQSEGKAKSTFRPKRHERLVALMKGYDPSKLFRLKHNINLSQ